MKVEREEEGETHLIVRLSGEVLFEVAELKAWDHQDQAKD